MSFSTRWNDLDLGLATWVLHNQIQLTICSYISLEGLATEYPSCTIRVCTSLIRRVTKTISIDFRVPATTTTHFQRYPSFDLKRVLIVLHFCYTLQLHLLLGLGFRAYYRFLELLPICDKMAKDYYTSWVGGVGESGPVTCTYHARVGPSAGLFPVK